jgi:hypothetical protein
MMSACVFALAGGVLAGEVQAAGKLLTIEEAQQASKATGRPIFAVAGSKT